MTRFLNSVDISTRADTEAQGALIGTVTTMPAASIYNVGCTVFYAGTTGTYDSGCLYTCVQNGASYKWEKTAVIAQGLELGTADKAVITDASGRVIAAGVTSAELGYLSGVTSGLQAQLNGKVPTSRTINGKALTSDIVLSASDIGAAPSSGTLGPSRALQTSTNGEVEVSNVTSVELSFLSGVTSAIQDQIDGKAGHSDIPTLISQLTNDTGFITNAVSDLVNYYTKDETYTKSEISNMISAIPKFSIQVVQSLPSSGISTTTIYLTPSGGGSGNSYSEYIYVNSQWELIGSTAVDLSDYYTKAQVNAMVTPVQSNTGITINGIGLQEATSGQPGLMTVAQVGQLATAVSNAQSALNGNVTSGTLSTDTSGNLTLTLNRTAGALSVGPTAITAARSVADGSGNNIASTYATQSALTSGLAGKADAGTEITGGAFSDNVLSLTKQDGTQVDIPFEYNQYAPPQYIMQYSNTSYSSIERINVQMNYSNTQFVSSGQEYSFDYDSEGSYESINGYAFTSGFMSFAPGGRIFNSANQSLSLTTEISGSNGRGLWDQNIVETLDAILENRSIEYGSSYPYRYADAFDRFTFYKNTSDISITTELFNGTATGFYFDLGAVFYPNHQPYSNVNVPVTFIIESGKIQNMTYAGTKSYVRCFSEGGVSARISTSIFGAGDINYSRNVSFNPT